jgi:L-alanine-DL-glutamate epimerase-like enolase superfamily enzyme
VALIRSLRWDLVSVPLARAYETARGACEARVLGIVQLTLDDGRHGVGEIALLPGALENSPGEQARLARTLNRARSDLTGAPIERALDWASGRCRHVAASLTTATEDALGLLGAGAVRERVAVNATIPIADPVGAA